MDGGIMQDLLHLKSVEYLRGNRLKHLSTLKHLLLYQDKITINLVEDSSMWALIAKIPTEFLSYDSVTYPCAKQAIFLNGTSDQLKYYLLENLPKDNYILRLNERLDLSVLENRFQITIGNSYVSYSSSSIDNTYNDNIVPGNREITDEVINVITRNGYTENELKKHFNNRAIWFGHVINGAIKSVCFVYQNYEDIWEIAGVHTLETERRKGFAHIVVASALTHMFDAGLIPRYEVDIRNANSIRLAENLGMKQFLRIDHYLLNFS